MLGNRLRSLRKSKNLTQEELARLLDISRGTYAHYEINKRSPDYETIQKLADFFEVQVDYLIGRTDDPSPTDENYDYKNDPTVTGELRELLDILNALPADKQADIIQQALTYAEGIKARNRSSQK